MKENLQIDKENRNKINASFILVFWNPSQVKRKRYNILSKKHLEIAANNKIKLPYSKLYILLYLLFILTNDVCSLPNTCQMILCRRLCTAAT